MARPRRGRVEVESGGLLVLDSGAITKIAETGHPIARAIWLRLTQRGWVTGIPAVTLAECIRNKGRTDASTERLLKRVDNTIPCDEALGKRAGALRGAVARGVRRPSGIDAIVAAVAATFRPSIVLTTDPDDLSALLGQIPDVTIIAV